MHQYSQDDKINQLIEDAWLNIDVAEGDIFNPLLNIPEELEEEPHLYITWLMMQPEYFSFVCKEILNISIHPIQALMLKEMWHRKFPMLIASRGFGKSFMMAVYIVLRLLLLPNRRVVICGSSFRQSKVIFEYIERIWWDSPKLRDMCDSNISGVRKDTDVWRFNINQNAALALPIGTGEKIRGQRANDIIVDEFASVPNTIFESVIAGFGAVNSSPLENVQRIASEKLAKKLGIYQPDEYDIKLGSMENQLIICGTASYAFNHFGEYWKRQRDFILSGGDPKKIETAHGGKKVDEHFNWKDYSIIRIPFELIPEGFMSESMVARSRALLHIGIYQMEYGACFTTDSNGFFKRSLIEQCVASKDKPLRLASGEVFVEATLRGLPKKSYIFAVDPASEADNFSIVILEYNPDHRKIVYCWVTNKKEFMERMKTGSSKETDFYSFCAAKIRDLMHRFPTEHIAIDSQGGGYAIIEALHDHSKIDSSKGEQPLWPVHIPDEVQDTDNIPGDHIIHVISFADAKWVSDANNGLRKDLEDINILFPAMDPVTLAEASSYDKEGSRVVDTLEDCVLEIEELKNELCTIVQTQTPSTGRDHWDTPEIKKEGGRKGRMRKDRYSALLMANMVGRTLQRAPEVIPFVSMGGWAASQKSDDKNGPTTTGPHWWNTDGVY